MCLLLLVRSRSSTYKSVPDASYFLLVPVAPRHLLFCRVTLGKSFLQFSAMKMAHSPPGHHSVTGRPSVNGLALAEYVIYRGEQVINVVCNLIIGTGRGGGGIWPHG